MSEWAYKKCPDCGQRTHMNTYCRECGGDPWSIEEGALIEIEAAGERIEALKGQIAGNQTIIDKYKNKLSPRGNNRETIQNIKRVYVGLKENLSLEMPFSSCMKYVRDRLLTMVKGKGIRVKCDEENNPPSVLDDNDLIARVYWHDERLVTKYTDLHFGKVMRWGDSVIED